MNNAKESDSGKLRVGIVFGGRSGEHEVSLMSAKSVIAALDPDKYQIIEIGITKDGAWLTGRVMPQLAGQETGASSATLLPDPESSALLQIDQENLRAARLSEVSQLDVVVPILHGTFGEDGTLQGLLELAGLPYVGAGVLGSAVGMDKAMFKYVMQANGIPVLDWLLLTNEMWRADRQSALQDIETKLTYPVFVKPANLGSSVGISKCAVRAELEKGIDEAFRYDRRVVVEQGIDARELEVAVLGNDAPEASIVGEIRPRREFYDYVAKYLAEPGSADESELLIPAAIDEETAAAVREMAICAYKAIDCAGMGRVDLLMDKETGELFMNEINTIPGFTMISMYPKLWEASGLSYAALLDRLIALAIDRHEQKQALETSYDVRLTD